jgi:endonuclease/exonuclease/phosphatase family metal-dependent hydrolase
MLTDHLGEFPSDSELIDASHVPFRTLPDSIFVRFTNLRSLNLSKCGLIALPATLFELPLLEFVDISDNELDFIPVEFGLLPSLQSLNISGNPGATRRTFTELPPDPDALISLLRRIVAPRDPLPPRQFLPLLQKPFSVENTFRVVTYNVLAPHLSMRRVLSPFCMARFLTNEHRFPLLESQLTSVNPSILCLQEIEIGIYNNSLEQEMNLHGFSGCYAPKGRGLDEPDQLRRDQTIGQATFVNRQEFEVIASAAVVLRAHPLCGTLTNASDVMQHDESVALLLVRMKTPPHAQIVIANTHLLWGTAEEIKQAQLYLATELAIEFGWSRSSRFDIIITGDFNIVPDSPAIKAILARPENFESTYPADCPSHWSSLGGNQIDHIFTTTYGIKPIAYLGVEKDHIGPLDYPVLPGEHHPSDHLMLASLFRQRRHPRYPPARPGPTPVPAPAPVYIEKSARTGGGLGLVLRGQTRAPVAIEIQKSVRNQGRLKIERPG